MDKTTADGFDVFLSHNSKDKPAVRQLKERLVTEGLRVWLDEDELRPGIPWQQRLEAGIRASKSIAVLVGADGLGPWEDEEMQGALRVAVKDRRPVIPVLLPGAPAQPELPMFLGNRTWVDLRDGAAQQGLDKLIWGITGQKPVRAARKSHQPPVPPVQTGFSPLHTLTPPVPDFTGRDAKLDELRRKLKQGNVAITGLRGMGGAGKTELARKLAAELKAAYPDAQIELNLKGVAPQPLSSEEVLAAILRPFYPAAKLPDRVEELAALLRQSLEGKHVLLLLDNAKDAQQVRPVLPLPPGCLAILTSPRHFTLPGLEPINLGTMEAPEARKLLLRIAPRLGSEADALAEACGRLPLALRLAASLLAERSQVLPADYINQLRQSRQRLQLLDKGGDDTAEQLGLQASFNLSFQQLAPGLQARFTQLAVFPAPFDHPAATAVWAAEDPKASDTLDTLVRLSFLEWNDKLQRFELHDLLRDFAHAQAQPTELAAARRRYAVHFVQVGRLAQRLYLEGGSKVLQGLALLDHERPHLEAAFDWLNSHLDKDSAPLLASLVNAVVYTSDLRFHPRQRICWQEAKIKAARLAADREDEGNALGNLGLAYAALGEARKAIEFYEQHLAIAREMGDRRSEGNALGNLGNAYYKNLGKARKGIEFYEQHLAIAREMGDRRGEGADLGNLGSAYAKLGETSKAIEFHEQALAIAREMGDRHAEGVGLCNLGNAYTDLGKTRKALKFYEQQLVITREIGDRRGEGAALWNSAIKLWNLRNRAEAIARAQAALKIFDAIEDPHAAIVRARLAEWRKTG